MSGVRPPEGLLPAAGGQLLSPRSVVGGFEVVFGDAADRANPVRGQVIEGDSVMFRRIVDIAAHAADVFLHRLAP